MILIILVVSSLCVASEWVQIDTGTTEHLRGGWIAPEGSVFAVGDGGTILRYDRINWSPMTSGTTNVLFDVWGSSATDVAASGIDTVLLYNGESWNPILSETGGQIYTPVWMPSTGEVIFVGVPGSGPFAFHWLYRYDRASEQWGFGISIPRPVMAFCGVNDDVTMVLDNGDILHTDNALNLTPIYTQPAPLPLLAAWLNPADCNEAFAADDQGTIYYFDGGSWTDMNAGIPGAIFGISGNSEADVYAVGIDGTGLGMIWHYDGASWTREEIPPQVPGLIDVAVGSLGVFGESGTYLTWLKIPTAADVLYSGNTGDPINTFTSELYSSEPMDFFLGGPLPLFFSRYYASELEAAGRGQSVLGANWRHNFQWRLTLNTNRIEVATNRGRLIEFEADGGGWNLSGRNDVPYQLVESGSEFILGDLYSQRLYTFNTSGRLTRIEDGRGNDHALSYSGNDLTQITDGLGRTLVLGYSKGNLLSVSDLTRTVNFGYTGDNLTSVTDVRGNTSTYSYDTGHVIPGLMTGTTRPEGNTPYAQTFDAVGQVVTQTDADGNTNTLAYNTPYTVMTDPLSNTRIHTHTDTGELTHYQGEDGLSFSMDYDGNGRRNGLTDRFGETTTYSYHVPSGKLESITNANGTITSYSHTARLVNGIIFYDLTGIAYPDGSSESFTYDASGNLISQTNRGGQVWSATYNTRGQPLTNTNPAGGLTTFTYHADGTLASRTDPAGNTTSYAYDSLKRLITIIHADATSRLFTYDDNDNLLTATDEKGNATTFTYDDNNCLETVTDSLGNTTTFTYDGLDRVTSVIDPLENASSRTYNELERFETMADANGNIFTYGYDARGRLTSITDSGGKIWSRTFDAESIITAATNPLLNSCGFLSDQMGRITRTTSPLGHGTGLAYDGMGRLTTIENP